MSEIQSVQAANESFYRAFEKRDISAMGTVWSQGIGSLCIHPGRDALRGWHDICASWEQIFKNIQYLEIETDVISTEIVGNLAYIVLMENLLQIIRGRRLESQTIATNIFEQMGGKWHLVHHHGSPLVS
ncbi:MAG: nuclear transport factor 2 family protein [Elainellaceae cyanobacterium]